MFNGKNEDVAIDGRQDHPLLPLGMRRRRMAGPLHTSRREMDRTRYLGGAPRAARSAELGVGDPEREVGATEVLAGLPEQDTAVAINAATLRAFRASPARIAPPPATAPTASVPA